MHSLGKIKSEWSSRTLSCRPGTCLRLTIALLLSKTVSTRFLRNSVRTRRRARTTRKRRNKKKRKNRRP